MRRPSITVVTIDPAIRPTLEAIKENLEIITGQRNNRIQPLRTDASLPEVIARLNQLIDRLN